MKDSYLLQGRERPTSREIEIPDKAVLIDGLKEKGLSHAASDVLKTIFQFQYMGSAEFEFGVIPQTVKNLALENLMAFTISLNEENVPKRYAKPNDSKFRQRTRKAISEDYQGRSEDSFVMPLAVHYIGVICSRNLKKEVEMRINDLIQENPNLRFKSNPRILSSLRPIDDLDSRKVGWLEIDNGFMFFVDNDAFLKSAKFFGAEIERDVLELGV